MCPAAQRTVVSALQGAVRAFRGRLCAGLSISKFLCSTCYMPGAALTAYKHQPVSCHVRQILLLPHFYRRQVELQTWDPNQQSVGMS